MEIVAHSDCSFGDVLSFSPLQRMKMYKILNKIAEAKSGKEYM